MLIKNGRGDLGYFAMDNRVNEGVPDEIVIAAGLPPGAGRGLFETETFTCSHCNTVVIKNPSRVRERAYCRGCEHEICDGCGTARAAGAPCRTFKQQIDEQLERATRPSLIILPNGV